MADLWRLIAPGAIHFEVLLKVTSYVFFSVWFLFYVAYAVIGFGLWKLKNWAYRATLALNEFFAVICVLALPFFVRTPALAFAVVSGTALPFAWIVWYLRRPRVRFAFGAWHPTLDPASTAGPPPGLSKMGKALVVVSIVASFALFLCLVMAAVEGMISASPIYGITVKQAQDSPCIKAMLGNPLTPRWGTEGSMEEGSVKGFANLEIPVRGPNGKGTLAVDAKKQNGVWTINSLVLRRGSEEIKILPAASASSCQ